MKHILSILALSVCMFSTLSLSQIPPKISYQGLLTDSSGIPFADGGNFRLLAGWAPNTDDTITLVHNGGLWWETSRSTN